eukprot:gnl/TRDRNA2_/TRDRNA2_80760_c0_seq1.p1 gnl/TRDRNA2_/TRDRNA2_80760_c0~~gnl/TRDRNA2_/TRDRNA2_80760_c0_seq1.p1  ORF type:complete len:409 (+),score=77.62 gnl/TRDRNA2_/TRDRNA2_80760_c0_seq1:70-1296(+)
MSRHKNASFSGVAVGLASKVSGIEAEEEWQEVDWVTWSTGDLAVEGDSYLLIFKPTDGSKTVKAKPLGCLLRASGVTSDDDGRTLVVSTSDAVHKLFRFTFATVADAREFFALSESAEAAQAAAESTANENGPRTTEAMEKLVADIHQKFADRWPLVFPAAELYSQDASDATGGNEVLLGYGAIVLLDPKVEESQNRVGVYELLFFETDEGAKEPVVSMPIAPKTTLRRQAGGAVCGEDGEGPAATFELLTRSRPKHTLTFEDAAVAARFARDLRVRTVLLDLSLRTAKGERTAGEARGELEQLRRRTFCRVCCWQLCMLMLLVAVGVAARAAQIFFALDSQPKGPAVLQALRRDAELAFEMAQALAQTATSTACALAGSHIPLAEVRSCASLDTLKKVQKCLKLLDP